MKTYTNLFHHSPSPCVVALGCFDGVHLGHRAVIGEAVTVAKSKQLPSLVWTFEEPPKNFFSPASVPLITDPQEKRAQIRALGVDTLVCAPFDPSVAALSPEEFFRVILCEKLKACHIVCGYNYSFGAKGAGNATLLRKLCEQNGIGISVIPPVSVRGNEISSTQIRAAVEEGRTEDACALLGRPYAIRTLVIDGQKLARRLGFPTVNQVFRRGILVPRKGVYATRVRFCGKQKYGITNVGTRPTVNGNLLCAETHIFDFNGNLYGKTVTVEFLCFLRPETKFASVEALSKQVHRDIEDTKAYLAKELGKSF